LPRRLAACRAAGREPAPLSRRGFLYPLAGEMQTIPGLGSSPAATRVDFDAGGRITGLF